MAHQIDENLERRELKPAERAKLIKARVDMLEARRRLEPDAEAKTAQLAQFSKVGAGRGNKGGLSQQARDLGIPRDKVRRALNIADLPPETIQKAEQLGLDGYQEALLAAATNSNQASSRCLCKPHNFLVCR